MPTFLSRIHHVPLLLLLCLVLVNSSVLFAGRTLLPIAPSYGILTGHPYGYNGPIPDWTFTVDQIGSLNACYAWDCYTSRSLRRGIIPFWNPYQGLGQPFMANGLSAIFYPVNWLHLVLPRTWWDLVFLLNWLLTSWFLYAYVRILGLGRKAALFGAIGIFACGSLQIYLPLREVGAGAAWWTFMLYVVERAYLEPQWRWRHIAIAGGIVCSITAGQPELTLVSLVAVSSYAVLRALPDVKGALRFTGRLFPGCAAGILLAAPHWLNLTENAFSSFTEHSAAAAVGLVHLPLKALPTYFFPYFYGLLQHNPFGSIINWALSPGWAPPLCLFFVAASLQSLRGNPRFGPVFLLVSAMLILAKIFGVPGVNLIGRLPLLNRVYFGRYASFLPDIAIAGLSCVGIAYLAQASRREWIRSLIVWNIIICAVFSLGVASIWTPLFHSGAGSEAQKTFVVFGLGGLGWAVLQPLGLWWTRSRTNGCSNTLYGTAAFGILLEGMAMASRGYSLATYTVLSATGLFLWVIFIWLTGSMRDRVGRIGLAALAIAIIGLFPIIAAVLASDGLPSRYDPLTPAPYLEQLMTLQNGGMYRSYSIDGMPFPDFAAPFELTSLDYLEAIVPTGTARFTTTYLDRGVRAGFLAGSLSDSRAPGTNAYVEFRKNKRFYDLVSARYVVQTSPGEFASNAAMVSPDSLSIPIPLTGRLKVGFVCPFAQITTIEIPIDTYGRKNPGSLELEVLDEHGTALDSASIPGEDLKNNERVEFRFSRIHDVTDRRLQMQLEFRPSGQDSMVAAYGSGTSESTLNYRIINPEEDIKEVYRDPETGVAILENRLGTPRAFLAPEIRIASSGDDALTHLEETPDLTHTIWLDRATGVQPEPASRPVEGVLKNFELKPNDVLFRYASEAPGILTLVDSYSEGWRAEIDGKEVPVLRVDGVFRGVRIEGRGEVAVHFWYRPPMWGVSLGLCCAGVVLLSFLALRRSRQPSF
jgi:hypothetical protein